MDYAPNALKPIRRLIMREHEDGLVRRLNAAAPHINPESSEA
jgi:hypothetical protein